uniref:Aminotransferase-like plant mobile domain-containing protein n=1 Tax=Ananas comosus var. bracteatus TaxID=296719 RepID=A0A6V7PF01_ANACO|nr:unnamed protein product [Ananas comosus var. bracteatus]
MADRDEPLYAGLRIPRAPPILGRLAEPLVLFDGVRSKVDVWSGACRVVAAFTSTHYVNHGEKMSYFWSHWEWPEKRDVLESLGVKILHDHPSWYGFKTFGDRTDVDGLKDWVNDVIAQYKTQLVQAEILGAIIAFKGNMTKILSYSKVLVEVMVLGDEYLSSPLWRTIQSSRIIRVISSTTHVYEWLVNRRPGQAVYYKPLGGFLVYRVPRKFASQSRKDSISEEECKKAPTYSEDGYLAAFLALWLCKFLMPSGKKDIISTETFIMASQMAHGTRFAARQHLRDERNFIWRPYSFNCSGEGWVHEVIDMRGRSDFPEEVQEWIISLRHSGLTPSLMAVYVKYVWKLRS